MYFSINELLKDKNDIVSIVNILLQHIIFNDSNFFKGTVKEILIYAQGDEAVLKQLFLQFVINQMGKKFTLTLEDMKDWNEVEVMSELVQEIFESVRSKLKSFQFK